VYVSCKVPQGTQESDSILEQQVDLTEKDSNMAKRSAKSDDNGVHVPRDPGLQPIVERFPLTLPSGEFFVQVCDCESFVVVS